MKKGICSSILNSVVTRLTFPNGYRSNVVALIILLSMLGGTLWGWYASRQQVMFNAAERFEFKVIEAEFAIRQRLYAYEQILLGGLGLFAASKLVERHEWRSYVETLQINRHYPGIRGVGFAQVISPDQLEVHTQAIRAEGFPNYQVHPVGLRETYTAIVFLEPFDWRNQRAFGYDMFSESTRRAAMIRARDSGQPAVSGRVTLVQETNQGVQHGFLMYLPLYQPGSTPQTIAERQVALLGYVYAPFRMNDLIEGTLGHEKLPNIRLQIYDNGQLTPDKLMYDSVKAEQITSTTAPLFEVNRPFDFNGRRWLLHFSSLPVFEGNINNQESTLVLLSGTLLSLLFTAVFWFLSLNRQRAIALAEANRGLHTEIAERTRLQASLVEAKEAAEKANQAKSEFLTNVSHELRTPLTLILAPLQQLTDHKHPVTDWAMQIRRIRRNALRLLNRVNDVLDFSKAEAGKFELRLEEVDLTKFIQTLVQDALAAANDKGCTLTWQLDPAIDHAYIDQRHFEKIVLNYVSNALKFTPTGGYIQIKTKRLDDARFEFSVSDSGIGIPKNQQSLLFQRFQQLDNSSTRHHSGTGIGLALVKQLAELMGGEVGVISDVGQGATFYVRLPLGNKQHAPIINHEPSEAHHEWDTMLRQVRFQEDGDVSHNHDTSGVAATDQSVTILVTDDNRDMRTYIAELLAGLYQVVTAADGLEAWALLERKAVNLVVSDVMMPNLDGFGLTARIKQSPQLAHLPVILVTARGGDQASADGLDAGADDYIAKPFSPEELLARVKAALRMADVQRSLRQAERNAGIAMIATTLLHNLGNVLNGITVSASIIADKLCQLHLGNLHEVAKLLENDRQHLSSKAEKLPEYLTQLASHIEIQQAAILQELDNLKNTTNHAVQTVNRHYDFDINSTRLMIENVAVESLLEGALALAKNAHDLSKIKIQHHYYYQGAVCVDRNLMLQILINLLINAHQAILEQEPQAPCIQIRSSQKGEQVYLSITDNGIGIDPKHLNQVFDQGFTTKFSGRGVGLHTSAIWARQMGCELIAESDGLGHGATFTLVYPWHANQAAQDTSFQEAISHKAKG
ncbi:CHASE domain-containing protein [Spartinivicinus poritis]|uniref:histidine kinase n=1 Tax=Spartinivicinus poritis TaxID=2994640 RepID=A0ABT5U423_9GAMM|nr:CHASE domain-containing protein [Spartinivicinus sp. A2-2]MDE1460726.1 CHASE domain-containing protein [Spartinivicinus sp. A2-2]